MKTEDFILAINILMEHHSNEIIINKVDEGKSVTKVLNNPTIHIKNCVPSVIKKLTEKGFTVGMSDGLMYVTKY